MRRVLRAQRRAIEAAAHNDRPHKFDLPSEPDLRRFLHALAEQPWSESVQRELRSLLAKLSTERATAALAHVAQGDPEIRRLVEQANTRAVHWADARVGNLITEVSDTTRQAVNTLVGDAVSEGLSNQDLADRLSSAFEFSDSRALMIARTETANADTAGTLAGYIESGVVTGKGWSADASACDICESMDGEEVGLHDRFSDGSDGPPAHPNCRCTVVPVLAEDPH